MRQLRRARTAAHQSCHWGCLPGASPPPVEDPRSSPRPQRHRCSGLLTWASQRPLTASHLLSRAFLRLDRQTAQAFLRSARRMHPVALLGSARLRASLSHRFRFRPLCTCRSTLARLGSKIRGQGIHGSLSSSSHLQGSCPFLAGTESVGLSSSS